MKKQSEQEHKHFPCKTCKYESRFSRVKQRQGNVQKSGLYVQSCILLIRKKCAALAKLFFLLIRSLVVIFFYPPRCFHLVFSVSRFYIFFED